MSLEDRLAELDLAADGVVEKTVPCGLNDADGLFEGEGGEADFGEYIDQAATDGASDSE